MEHILPFKLPCGTNLTCSGGRGGSSKARTNPIFSPFVSSVHDGQSIRPASSPEHLQVPFTTHQSVPDGIEWRRRVAERGTGSLKTASLPLATNSSYNATLPSRLPFPSNSKLILHSSRAVHNVLLIPTCHNMSAIC